MPPNRPSETIIAACSTSGALVIGPPQNLGLGATMTEGKTLVGEEVATLGILQGDEQARVIDDAPQDGLLAGHLPGLVGGLFGGHPLGAQGLGHLQHLNAIKRLPQNQQAIGGAQASDDLLPGEIAESRAQNALQARINAPQGFDGGQAIPAGGHPHVDKGHRRGLALGLEAFQGLGGFLALAGDRQTEGIMDRQRSGRGHPEHQGGQAAPLGTAARGPRGEDRRIGIPHPRVIIHQQ